MPEELLVFTRLPKSALPAARRAVSEAGGDVASVAADVHALMPLAEPDGGWRSVALSRIHGADAELLALATPAAHRGRGYASRLLDGLADELRATGCARLLAKDHDPATAGWLMRRGFRRSEQGELELGL